jgi:hypothetical protein
MEYSGFAGCGKGADSGEKREKHPSGAKARAILATFGMTEVVP